MGSSTTTQTTTIPDASPQEQALMGMVGEMVPDVMEEMGYRTKKIPMDISEDEGYKRHQKAIKDAEDAYFKHVTTNAMDTNKTNKLYNELEDKKAGLASYESAWVPEDHYKYESEAIDPDTGYTESEFEELSDEKKAAITTKKEAAEEDAETLKTQQDDITKSWMDNVQKFLSGDYTITPEQKQMISDIYEPIKTAINDMFDEVETRIGETDAAMTQISKDTEAKIITEIGKTESSLLGSLNKSFKKYTDKLKGTKLDVFSALDAVGDQIMKTGSDMESSLKNVIATNRELMKMGIEDYTGQITKQVSTNAAMMGRSPDDPEYSMEIQSSVARQVKEGNLSLANMEAQGMLSIKERTGAELEQLLRQKADIEGRTGEQIAMSELTKGQQEMSIKGGAGDQRTAAMRTGGAERLGIAERTGAAGEQASLMRGQGKVGVEEKKSDIGMNMPLQAAQLGMGVSDYWSAVDQQGVMNSMMPANYLSNVANPMQNERMATPTTTSKTTQPAWQTALGAITGVASAGASIYSGVVGAGALSSIAGRMGNAATSMGTGLASNMMGNSSTGSNSGYYLGNYAGGSLA